MPKEFSPRFIAAVDQGYAAAKERLEQLTAALAEDMAERGPGPDAAPWGVSVRGWWQAQLTYGQLPVELIEVWQAAMYMLARQRMEESS